MLALDFTHRPALIGIDFHTYVAAAMVGLQSGWSRIYDQGLVSVAQRSLVPGYRAQPFLSPPTVAWLVAPLQALPYPLSFDLWMFITLTAMIFALAWSTDYRGLARIVAVGVALVPWWLAQAVMVGQVVPLVAASLLISWRLLRAERDVAAGLVLALLLLKPNTALLAPIALLIAGRVRAFAAWAAAAAVIAIASLATLGVHGFGAYVADLSRLPSGANHLTLSGTFGLAGTAATVTRVLIVAVTLVTAFRYRAHAGLVLAAAALGSLMISPYLHASDLCVLMAAGWMIWHERPDPLLRAILTFGVLIATPLDVIAGLGPPLNRWLLFEMALALVLAVMAWLPEGVLTRQGLLTGRDDFGKQAPA